MQGALPWQPFEIPVFSASPQWMREAACTRDGVDPEWFFPERGQSTKLARATCAACPVRSECLRAALESGEEFGVFGGTSPRERKAMKEAKRRNVA